MASDYTCDEDLVRRLPLPLAQLYRRAHNAKTPLERHLAAYYLWEAALKLLGSVAIVEYAEQGRHDPALAERLQNLARPSLGHWWEFVRLLLPVLAEAERAPLREVREIVLGKARDGLPRLAGLDSLLREALDGRGGPRNTVRVGDLLERLVRYRNQELGHGAAGQRPAAFYERMGGALLAGGSELLARLDLLGGRALVYVDEVRRQATGGWLVELYLLRGETARRLESFALPATDTSRLPRPQCLYLGAASNGEETATGVACPLQALHPLVTYEAETGEVLFLNARRGRQRTEYLCYTSGRVADRMELAGERRELLARVLNLPVEPAQAQAWEAHSEAEEPPPEPSAAAPRIIGEFEVVSELGRGGMGVVYRAWQPSLGRQVALKCMLRSGDPKAEARFAREIRALGRVEHPHLVKVFTSGSEGEQWFYAMELVEGAPLATICDKLSPPGISAAEVDPRTWQQVLSTACEQTHRAEKLLSQVSPAGITTEPAPAESPSPEPNVPPRTPPGHARQAVELIRQVAGAAHALHEAGVIHRDIKPGNIMVTADGTQAVLMDLGLAQLADEAEGRLTRTRQFVGTLRYASPEQVLTVGRLDRRSDVYSLGVTLWELLTLRPMYGATDQTPTPELMRRIQLQEPERVRKYHPGIAADLEAIVLKCLEKDPNRRYATASELADDLGRWLRGEAVTAQRPTVRYVLGKFVRRNRLAVAAATGLLAAVVAGTALAFYHVQKSRVLAEQERDRARENFQLALDTNIALGKLGEHLKALAGTQSLAVESILKLAESNFRRLLDRAGPSPSIMEAKARMLSSFSEVYLELGRTPLALASAEEAQDLFIQLREQEPQNARWQAGYATSLEKIAVARLWRGDHAEALVKLREALALHEELVEREPDSAEWQLDLATCATQIGNVLRDQGDYPAARKAYERGLDLRKRLAEAFPEDLDRQAKLALSYHKAGTARSDQDELPAAQAAYDKALAILKDLTGRDGENVEWHQQLVELYDAIAMVQRSLNHADEAVASMRAAQKIADRFYAIQPGNTIWEQEVLRCRYVLSDLRQGGDLTEAIRQRLDMVEKLYPQADFRSMKDPENAAWRLSFARLKVDLGFCLVSLASRKAASAADLDRADKELRGGISILEDLVKQDPTHYTLVLTLSAAHLNMNSLLLARGDASGARDEERKAYQVRLDYFRRQAVREPDNAVWQLGLARSYQESSWPFLLGGDPATGVAAVRQALAIYENLSTEGDDDNLLRKRIEVELHLSRALLVLANTRSGSMNGASVGALLQSSEYKEALDRARKVVALIENRTSRAPDNLAWERDLVMAYERLAQELLLRGDAPGARAAFLGSLLTLEDLFKRHPDEARRDPLAREEQASTTLSAIVSLGDVGAGSRGQQVRNLERAYWMSQEPGSLDSLPMRAQGLVNAYIDLTRTRDPSLPNQAAEQRWAVRRGLSVLRQEQAARRLHPVQGRLIPFFEKALQRLPSPAGREPQEAALQAALDGMDYKKVAALSIARNQARAAVQLLAREFADAAEVPWARDLVRRLVVQALMPEPRLGEEILTTATAELSEAGNPLGNPGRQLFAFLARYSGDLKTAAAFDDATLKEAWDGDWVGTLALRASGNGHKAAAARLYEAYVQGVGERTTDLEYQILAGYQLGAGKLDAAEQTIGKVMRHGGGDTVTQSLRAQVYFFERRFPDARTCFQQILDRGGLKPQNTHEIQVWLAQTDAEMGEAERAETLLKSVLAVDANDLFAELVLAGLYAEQGKNLEEAEALVRKVLKVAPGNADVQHVLGWVLTARQKAIDGMSVLEKVADDESFAHHPEFFEHLGDAYLQAGRPDKAGVAWRKTLQLFPRTTDPADRHKTAVEGKLKALAAGR